MDYIYAAAIILVMIMLVGGLFAAFYTRAQKDTSYVRTGLWGETIIMGGGALVLPVVHEVLPINMKTMRIEITREQEHALVTKDPLRVDVTAEFFLRVSPDEQAISTAARALGNRTMEPGKVQEIFEAPCVAALRSVASGMELDELHRKRADFEHNVEECVNAEFRKNGLELVSVALTRLDQTDRSYFDANNSFDARGLTILQRIISDNEKNRNHIAQENAVAIKHKNLEATIQKEKLDYEEVLAQNERKRQKAENDAETQLRIEELTIQKELSIEQAQQAANIRQAELEREVSQAWMETNKVKAEYEKISEEIRTARERAEAERARIIELISAEKEARRQRIIAEANAEAEKLAAQAAQVRYEVEAAGKRAINEASNLLSNDQIAMQVKLEIVRQLPQIIRESVRPIENIEGIKIMHIDGLNNAVGGRGKGESNASGSNSLADQVVDSALRYRAQVPLIETLLSEVGLKGNSINELTGNLREEMRSDSGKSGKQSSADDDNRPDGDLDDEDA
jgi:uncharacterized membrane protein YqiK